MIDERLAAEYRRIRSERPVTPARSALQWAHTALEVEAVEAVAEWRDVFHGDVLAIATVGAVEIVAYSDPEPYDWGDIEPSDDDREALEVIGVGVRVAGEVDDLDSLWGVGYLNHDFQRQAIETAVWHGMVDRALTEIRERAEWAARDTITVA